MIEARTGNLDDVLSINSEIPEWTTRFSREHFEEFLKDKNPEIVVGYSEDKPIGFIVSYTEGDHLKIWVIGVDPGFRRQGIFRAMHKYCETIAKNKGLSKIELDIAKCRESMISASRALGYHIVGVEHKEDWPNTRIFLEKPLY